MIEQQAASETLRIAEQKIAAGLLYLEAGKPKEALQLIDGTAILHPDLGGGELRERFLHLRQRIGSGNP